MKKPILVSIPFALALFASAAAHAQSAAPTPAKKEFVLHKAEHQEPQKGSIKPTATDAALKLRVVDKETGAGIAGVVVRLTAPGGQRYYADETDADGDSEVAVPISQTYEMTYLSLGHSDFTAKVAVDGKPDHTLHLTLRYKRFHGSGHAAPRVVLDGLQFDTGKADIRPESLPRLDTVFEYMSHKPSLRIEISGHTDNVGNPNKNKALSLRRAQSCRSYLVSKGIDPARIVAVGHGDEMPIASNATDEGRQQNRRIEVVELQ